MVWVSKLRVRGESRLALEECPVSYITGESIAAVEDFLMHQLMGGGGAELLNWPSRRVDAFAVLGSELRKLEMDASDES